MQEKYLLYQAGNSYLNHTNRFELKANEINHRYKK